jgi:hypothetical protein
LGFIDGNFNLIVDAIKQIQLQSDTAILIVGNEGINLAANRIIVGFHSSSTVGFFGGVGADQGAIVGALSAVTDPNARAVLASICNQLDRLNLILNSTT